MDVMIHDHVLPQLHERRRRLEEARRRAPAGPDLGRLLAEVDAALARAEDGTFGRCQVCHDPVETDRLLADPLVCLCLDHLSEAEQRALERDLELAARIQRNLGAPAEVAGHGWSLRCHAQPAGPVGGDWCDVFPAAAGDGLIFVLGDVSGKGLGAALLMAKLQATLRAVAYEGMPLSELGASTNRIMCRDGIVGKFATLVYLDLGPGESRVRILNAGHMPPLVVRREGIGTLEPRSLPVGVEPSEVYEEQAIDLQRDELLIAYSDGVTEARSAAGEFFGEARLLELLPQVHGLPAETAGGHILGAVQAFMGQERLPDDLSLVLVRRTS